MEPHFFFTEIKRGSKSRKHRNQMTTASYIFQLDGSLHRWFSDRLLCLMTAVQVSKDTLVRLCIKMIR